MDIPLRSLSPVIGDYSWLGQPKSPVRGESGMERPIVFGSGATDRRRSAERSPADPNGGPGGKRARDGARSPSPSNFKQHRSGPQVFGKGFNRNLDQNQRTPPQLSKGFVKASEYQVRSGDQNAFQQSGKVRAKSPEGQVGGTYQQPQQVSKGNQKGHDPRQSAPQSFTKGLRKSPEQSEEDAAKARRLVRFGPESKSAGILSRQALETGPAKRQSQITSSPLGLGPGNEAGNKSPPTAGLGKGDSIALRRPDTVMEDISDMDGLENFTAEAILGVCPDMCPEVEREERERKGDLDRFERVEGDRNQTSVDVAVKKYTRTAEKDAVLIRPLPVLKTTMNYLLSLLERHHEDDLLSIHNFLWDRMRAVRMDLRMQHIFGEDAIAMHERMIRFHILAMHELCEYVVGETGVSEGFNAHLNIEQMNKTSVDLFQMYEDHRKRGVFVPSEPEFRGYYALLKLDKHPGYRVEPAELSLDLAKMAPDIRRSAQVLFAREVARACRGNNFVAFFRLARQATYLQACLMHAHFAKLRTQALASLNSGLSKNQGIPLSTVVDWLGMEGEDIEALITYHGFSTKHFEEPYMVKEGPFLNKDQDFPTYRSQMVEGKRSAVIADDVLSGRSAHSQGSTMRKVESFGRKDLKERVSLTERSDVTQLGPSFVVPAFSPSNDIVEEDMPDYIEPEEQPVMVPEVVPSKVVEQMSPNSESNKRPADEDGTVGKRRRVDHDEEEKERERRRLRYEAEIAVKMAVHRALEAESKRQQETLRGAAWKAEADIGKQRRWFRKWRRKTVARALERQKRIERAEAALGTLSLGYPVLRKQVHRGEVLNVEDRRMCLEELLEKQAENLQELWVPLNVPQLIFPMLREKNPLSRILYWKLLTCTGGSPAGNWIRTKISSKESKEEGDVLSEDRFTVIADEKFFTRDQDGPTVGLWYSAKEVPHLELGRISTESGDSQVAFRGVNGFIFVSDGNGEGFSSEHARLRTLLGALGDVGVPLLVISTVASNVGDKVLTGWDSFLKADGFCRGKLTQHRIICIGVDSEPGGEDRRYYREDVLTDGLRWLASASSIQPILRSVLVSDLVREHLDDRLRLLLQMPYRNVRPELCVNVFNEALTKAADEIKTTARILPVNWPPNWILSVEKTKVEDISLSSLREPWNQEEILGHIFTSLQSCSLPDVLAESKFDAGSDLQSQKVEFESALVKYFSSLEGVSLDNPTAKWELDRVVQNGCSVRWTAAGPILEPKWVKIFQSFFTTRLLFLTEASVYITRVHKRPLESEANVGIDRRTRPLSGETDVQYREPSLDELICLSSLEQLRRKSYQLKQAEQLHVGSAQQSKGGWVVWPAPDKGSMPSTAFSVEGNGGTSEYELDQEALVSSGQSMIQEQSVEWLLLKTSLDGDKSLHIHSTDAEMLLDDLMKELEMHDSSVPSEVHGNDELGIPDPELVEDGVMERHQVGTNSQLASEQSRWTNVSVDEMVSQACGLKIELTESEILLQKLVAEFNIDAEKQDVNGVRELTSSGELEQLQKYQHVVF